MIWEFLQLTNKMTVLSEGLKIWGEWALSKAVAILWPLVEIGSTDLPKSEGAMAPPGTTDLLCVCRNNTNAQYSADNALAFLN